MDSDKKGPGRPKKGAESYRKPFKYVRIKGPIAGPATARAVELAQDLVQYVNDAVRMRLEQEGRWPPPKAQPPSS